MSLQVIEIPALTNEGYFSQFYLDYRISRGLAPVLKKWRDAEKVHGSPSPATRLARLLELHHEMADEARQTAPDPDEPGLWEQPTAAATKAQHELNRALLRDLGWEAGSDGTTLHVGHRGDEIVVPAALEHTTSSGRLLVALETVWTNDPSELLANPTGGEAIATGRLLDPLELANGSAVATSLADAARVLFAVSDDPPRYVLGVGGGAMVLLDRATWAEGRWLGADVSDAIARGDTTRNGELELLAALFARDSLDPGDEPTNLFDDMAEAAAKEAEGVSKELRSGMRRSVELLGNAVVADMRLRKKEKVLGRPDLESDLTKQILRWLYRVIVLLYAEARPGLEILPTDAPEYEFGYGLGRLKTMALIDLKDPSSLDARHIQKSLLLLFDKVRHGHQPARQQSLEASGKHLEFAPLRSTLFDDDACPLLDRAHIPDHIMQQVIRNLCYTTGKHGRQQVSYATLGVNQLGAVYEALMSFKGFIATEDLYEVDKDGDPDNGSWVIPVHQADEYPDDVFVMEEDEFGQPKRVRYDQFDFVYRLAGRDRERSASFYTPEVLTEFTVRHTLDEFELANPDMTADDWLDVTVCEPALGSGSFLNEVVDQLATRYLAARQEELDEQIPQEDRPQHLQRAKAHFAVNQAYGVDLNASGVELAEVALWLTCMYPGLTPPRLDARIRRGNSLIGARRAMYSLEELEQRPWKGTKKSPLIAPTAHPLFEIPLGSGTGIHHFLVPGEGWGTAAYEQELRGKGGKNPKPGLAEEWAAAVKDWVRDIHKKPTKRQRERLSALSRRVEDAWAVAAEDATRFHRSTRQQIDELYGVELRPHELDAPAEARRRFLDDENSPAGRLRIIMNAWCALWMWGPDQGTGLPGWDQWLDAMELLLGQPDPTERTTLFDEAALGGQTSLESIELFGRATVDEVYDRHPWLASCQDIAAEQAFFHWELEHAPIFVAGGFDLQVGNPPWVRPTWDEPACLAEHDPWWGVTNLTQTSKGVKESRRDNVLQNGSARQTYCGDFTEVEGIATLLGSETVYPELVGVQANLYSNFMATVWRHTSPRGMAGLLHPESHLVDPDAGQLRAMTYARQRRHWQFANERKLFDDVHNETEFGVHVYGSVQPPDFRQAVNLLEPGTLDRSMDHDGFGELPGIQHPEGGWDLRPHGARIVNISLDVLKDWVSLFDPPGTRAEESRLLRPQTTEDLAALSVFAQQTDRLAGSDRYWSRGFDEDKLKYEGTGEWRTDFPDSLDDVILQGPHILNATPFAQQPNENCKNNKDWSAVDLESMAADFIPRTNYQRVVSPDEFRRRQPRWSGEPFTSRYRETHREFVGSGSVRTVQSCLMPPGPVHVHKVNSNATESDRAVARFCGTLSSLPFDYVTKVYGASTLGKGWADALPIPPEHPELDEALLLRVLRLNCLTAAYEPLWNRLLNAAWGQERFVAVSDHGRSLGHDGEWSPTTPLRLDEDRWLALCEIDAIVALLLGLTEEQLLQMYRSQFAVLRKYEHQMAFDAKGRQICGIHHAYGHLQSTLEDPKGAWNSVEAFIGGDATVDLDPFVPPFRRADREAAMGRAFRAFCERFDLEPGVPAGEQVSA